MLQAMKNSNEDKSGESLEADRRLYGLFNDSFPPVLDGVTLTVDNYAKWISSTGHKTCVITPANPEMDSRDYPVIDYFSLPIRTRKPYRYGYPLADFNIWHILRDTRFDLVHAHSPFSAGRLAIYAARHHNVPLIGTFHSKYRDDLQHSFRILPWMTDLIMGRILDFFNACDHVWIPQANVEETVREYGFKGEVTVMENGNDFADIICGDARQYKSEARARTGTQSTTLSLLFVGQHIYEKGTAIILDALAAIKDSVDFQMTFIGTGYAADELKKKTTELGLDNRVRFLGIQKDRQTISDHYAAADLFLFPSAYDNAPLVVREAAAMATPSVLLKGSTAALPITDRWNGFLTEPGSRALAELLLHLSSQKEAIAEAGLNAARSLVRGWHEVVKEAMARYEDIIATYHRYNHK